MKPLLKFKDLKWPVAMNLHLLAEVISEKTLREFLVSRSKESRLKRRIMLPSETCIRKIFCHYFWSQIQDGKMSWNELKNYFRSAFGSMKALKITKREVQRLYEQRQIEIERERK